MVDIVLSVVFWIALAFAAVQILTHQRASRPEARLQAWSGVASVLAVALAAGLIYSLLAQFGFGMAMEDYCREIMTTVEPEPLINGYPNEWFTGPANCYQAKDGRVVAYAQTSFSLLRFVGEVVGPVALATSIVAYGFRPAATAEYGSLAESSR